MDAAWRTKIWLAGVYTKDMEREDDLKLQDRIARLEQRFPSIFVPVAITYDEDDLHG